MNLQIQYCYKTRVNVYIYKTKSEFNDQTKGLTENNEDIASKQQQHVNEQ